MNKISSKSVESFSLLSLAVDSVRIVVIRTYLLIYLLTYLYIYLLTQSLSQSLNRSFTQSLTQPITQSPNHTQSLIHSINHSLTHSITQPLTHSNTHSLNQSLTRSLTPRSTVPNLTGFQLVKKFPTFFGTQRFITAFTNARQLSLSWASSSQSILPLLIISNTFRLCQPSSDWPQSRYELYIAIP
jgi:hypothetical protein